MNDFAEQLRRAEELAKSGSLLIPGVTTDDPPQTLYIPGNANEPTGGDLWSTGWETDKSKQDYFDFINPIPGPLRAAGNIAKNADYPKSATEKPTEEFARNYLAMMLGTTPDNIVNVKVTPDGKGGWHFNGNLKVKQPRMMGFFEAK